MDLPSWDSKALVKKRPKRSRPVRCRCWIKKPVRCCCLGQEATQAREVLLFGSRKEPP
jgi:hypothetical protein